MTSPANVLAFSLAAGRFGTPPLPAKEAGPAESTRTRVAFPHQALRTIFVCCGGHKKALFNHSNEGRCFPENEAARAVLYVVDSHAAQPVCVSMVTG